MTTSSIRPQDGALPEAKASETLADPKAESLLEHEYDGIREYDNPMPAWWVRIFWATFVFSVGYIVHYHVSGNGESVSAEYEAEARAAREVRAQQALGEAPSEEALGKLMADAALMVDARAKYVERCAPCHAAEGQGLIGPNLTDDHWIHGQGKLMDIYQTVSHGVPAKGMPAWELQLTPAELRKIVALVGTFRGKNIAGKAPEGQPAARQ